MAWVRGTEELVTPELEAEALLWPGIIGQRVTHHQTEGCPVCRPFTSPGVPRRFCLVAWAYVFRRWSKGCLNNALVWVEE